MDVDQSAPSTTYTDYEEPPHEEDVNDAEVRLRKLQQYLGQYVIAYQGLCPDLRPVAVPYAIGGVRLEYINETDYGFFSTAPNTRTFTKISSLNAPLAEQVAALRPFLHDQYASFLNDWAQLVTRHLLA